MKNTLINIIIFAIFSLMGIIYAQSTRSLINDGVDLYHKGKINDAEVNFKKGLTNEPKNLEANFNIGDAFYKNKRYDEAIDAFQKSLLLSNVKKFKSKVYHNIGNSFLKQNKFDESIEAYKNALKLNPNDEQTKYNLSYALQQKKDNKNNKNKDKDKKDKDKNNKDKNKDKNDPNKDQNKNDKDKNQDNPQNKDKNDTKNNQKQNPAQDKKNKISKEQAKQILNALMNNEKDLQKKLRKMKAKVVKTEKDW
ncbi:MAG: hypothetical protein CO128_08500 [Ignavibacteriales bacterium CG_4_9_14_3_um_filter_30_11]|nr:MAG: hypothetical protein CO128_08500 [Ignavibacteriales bacterium CG_4_9_14_3_um_filter_30_11]